MSNAQAAHVFFLDMGAIGVCDHCAMSIAKPPRAILAANLRRMIDGATTPGTRPSVRAWALSKGLDVRMIDRLVKGEHAVTLDSLDKIAEACGLQAWQLLLEDLNPANPPDAPITEDERALLNRLKHLLAH